MGLLDLAFAPVRAVLGVAEREGEKALPVRDIEQIQTKVLETAEAIRLATETIEQHVEVVETLATSVPPLTTAVEQLTLQLVELTKLLAPVAAAERDVARVEGFFSRRHRHEPADPPPSD